MKYQIIPVTPYQQNSTLLICEHTNKAAIVDPGGELNLILDQVQHHNVTLESILLTHGHLDHVGGVAALVKQLSLPVYGPHVEDAFWINALKEQAEMLNFPPSESFTPTRWFKDNDEINVGEELLQVIHTPGHTPGHVVFYSAADKLAIVGDVLFNGSIGRTDFPKGDYHTLIDSIKQKLWPLGKEIDFIPGHGPMSTFGEEMRSNPFVGEDGQEALSFCS